MNIIFVHGMGDEKPGSSYEFRDRIVQAATGKTKTAQGVTSIRWHECYWAPVTQSDEVELYGQIGRAGFLHRYMFSSLGDIVAYSRLPYSPNKYDEIQKCFKESVQWCSHESDPNGKSPLIVIGHSLGSIIASDGLWDLFKSGAFPTNLTLHAFFTLGAPIALFALRYGLKNFNKPIRPPVWVNFYYKADLVAFPLKVLNDAYDEAVTKDVCLSPGNLIRELIARIPIAGIISHSWYFDDKRVIGEIVSQI